MAKFDIRVNGSNSISLLKNPVVQSCDRVKTKSGRHGVVKSLSPKGDAANVWWDDGEEFPIKCVHLEVLYHNAEVPSCHSKKVVE